MKQNNDSEIEYDESQLIKILKEKELLKEKSNQFVPFLKRKDVDWSDVKPLEQFSPEIDILKMEYDDKFTEISSYFRAILHNNEISVRAFNLTTELIQVNSTNYMAWFHRRQCIDSLKIDLKNELNWLDEIGVVNQKNYQIWHHRKVVIEKLNDPSHEKAFLDRVFEEEPKNFHAWCHRIWVVRRFNLFEGEIEYIENMLESDIRNNSVWNYRFFVITYTKELNNITIKNEIDYTIKKIRIVPNNESPFNYLRGYFNNANLRVNFSLLDFPEIKENLDNLIKQHEDCVFAHSFLYEWYLKENNIIACQKTCDLLSDKLDIIRKKYWQWKKLNLNKV